MTIFHSYVTNYQSVEHLETVVKISYLSKSEIGVVRSGDFLVPVGHRCASSSRNVLSLTAGAWFGNFANNSHVSW